MNWIRTYKCTADFRPYLHWLIEAESPCSARMELVKLLGIPYEQTDAEAN
jgi:hypothetical protein